MGTDTEAKGHEVTIKIRAFPYYTDGEDVLTGQTRRFEHIARRGDTVTLNDADYDRAVRFDAIRTDADNAIAGEVGEPTATVQTSSVDDLATWIREAKPTVKETIAAAEGNPTTAQTLLQAEDVATGQQPRQGVVDGLNQVINAGTGGETDDSQ